MKCVTPASGGAYYPDHLPLLGKSHVHVCLMFTHMYKFRANGVQCSHAAVGAASLQPLKVQ